MSRIKIKERAFVKKGKLLKGRQIMWLIRNFYNVNPSMAQANTIIDLVILQWKGDGDMDEFLNRWGKVLGPMNMVFDAKKNKEKNYMLRDMLLPKMEKSAVLKKYIAFYYRLMTEGKPPTFELLRDHMEAYILRTDLKNNRDKQ